MDEIINMTPHKHKKKKVDLFSEVRKRTKKIGQPPGTAIYTGDKEYIPTRITVTTYDSQNYHEASGSSLDECLPAEKIPGVTWVNVEGLHDTVLIDQLAKRFNIHPLTIEDILNVGQRPKVEEFEDYLFVTLKVLHLYPDSSFFSIKQISFVIGSDFVISFNEVHTTLFDSLRARLKSTSDQRMRQQGSDYLTYRMIDIIVDQYFVVLEAIGDKVEDVEERLISSPTSKNARMIYRLKRQMLLLRKTVWPMREAISHLLHADEDYVKEFTRVYLRDVYDHTIQAIDTLETFRDMLSNMLDMYLSSLTNRMNEIMKTLTIIATIFIPITFIASFYGMNFSNIPGMRWAGGVYLASGIMLLSVVLMLAYFRKKKWL